MGVLENDGGGGGFSYPQKAPLVAVCFGGGVVHLHPSCFAMQLGERLLNLLHRRWHLLKQGFRFVGVGPPKLVSTCEDAARSMRSPDSITA